MRPFVIGLHRWIGLAMSSILIVVGLTGSVQAFRDELDVWLNPALLTVPSRDAPTVDPIDLHAQVASLYPETTEDIIVLDRPPGRSVAFEVREKAGSEEISKEVFFDPYTGDKIGERLRNQISLRKEHIISFLNRLHTTLAFPLAEADWGTWVLGIVALAWTFDCFVGFYLTLPARQRTNNPRQGKVWFARWTTAWRIKRRSSPYRVNLDMHRAFGLWTWVMLFIFSWSAVGFNLKEAYSPVMETLFGPLETYPELLVLATPPEKPKLDWHAARTQGRALLRAHAQRNGYTIDNDFMIALDRSSRTYMFYAFSSIDRGVTPEAVVSFDANTGEQRALRWPRDPAMSKAAHINFWLSYAHMAGVFGLPMKILVCAMGFVITALSVTGVYIWWKKRKARGRRKSAGSVPEQATDGAVS